MLATFDVASELVPEAGSYIAPGLDRVRSNPKNLRRVYLRIRELARSIDKLGLLQNLVVVADSEPGYFIVKAGERRLRALQLLAKEGKWSRGVPAVVAPSKSGELINVAENASRLDVPVWHEGHRFFELLEAGMRQSELAEAVGRSQQYVSYAKNLAESLAPETIERLDRIDSHYATARVLRMLSRLQTPDGEPDGSRQVLALDSFLKGREKPASVKKHRHRDKLLKGRIELLEALSTTLPPHQERVIQAAVHFIFSNDQELRL